MAEYSPTIHHGRGFKAQNRKTANALAKNALTYEKFN
jgi:hypothetical protein